MDDPGANAAPRTFDDSLCAQPTEGFRSFHWYVDAVAGDRAYAEMIAAMNPPGRPVALGASLVGDVLGRLRAAARGQLADGALLEPVRDDPLLWEIRWKLKKHGEYRLYHAEPRDKPDIVGLRFHRKDVSSGDSEEIDRLQDAEIAEAGRRYDEGGKKRWGHGHRCSDCLHP